MSKIDSRIAYAVAVAEDVDGLCDLLAVMHAENGIGRLNISKTRRVVEGVVQYGVALIALYDDERIVASIGLEHQPWWYSDDFYVGDRWTFVHPDYRRSKIATRLLRQARNYAKALGLPLLMGPLTPNQPERVDKLYARHFQPIGRIFMEARL